MKLVSQYVKILKENNKFVQWDEFVCTKKTGNLVDVKVEDFGFFENVINFSSNDILGFTEDIDVQNSAIQAIKDYGTSNSGSAALLGKIDLHCQLEKEIADFKEFTYSHIFVNGWMAMFSLFSSLCSPLRMKNQNVKMHIFSDSLNHGCIINAIKSVKASYGDKVRNHVYKHCDVEDLEEKLSCVDKSDEVIIVCDSVFSMDGDITPLTSIIEIANNYENCILILDEAHSTGALGKRGRGIFEHFGMSPTQLKNITPIVMTTFSKFGASAGAAICFNDEELKFLFHMNPYSALTISVPPASTAAVTTSFRKLKNNPELVRKLRENTNYLRTKLESKGFSIGGETQVISVFLSDVSPKVFCRNMLKDHGFMVAAVWDVATPRLRIVSNVLHSTEEMDKLVEAMVDTKKTCNRTL